MLEEQENIALWSEQNETRCLDTSQSLETAQATTQA